MPSRTAQIVGATCQYLKVTAGAIQVTETGLQDLMPGEAQGLRVIQQPGQDPRKGREGEKGRACTGLCPLPLCVGALAEPLPQSPQQQRFVGPGSIECPQQQKKGLGLLLEALKERPDPGLCAVLLAQLVLQVQ